jgi:hypothetical protein
MEKNIIDYWVNFAFNKMREEKKIMPNVINSIFESPEFKSSGVSEEELKITIKKSFENERLIVLNKIKNKLKGLN